MKTKVCSECQSILTKQLKVQKADYQFQFKKLKQDKSTEKALYQVHLQKQIRRCQDLYNKQKTQKEQQNHNWLVKYDTQKSNYQKQITDMKISYQQEIKQKVQTLISQSTLKYNTMKNKYQQNIKNMEQKQVKQSQGVQRNHNNIVNNLQMKHQQYGLNIKKAHKQIIQKNKKDHSSKVAFLQSQLNTEIQLHDKKKQECKQLQTKLYKEIFNSKCMKNDLENTISEKQTEIKKYKQQIEMKKEEIQTTRVQHEKICRKINEMHKQQKTKIQIKNIQQLKRTHQQSLNICNRYETAIQRIQSTRLVQKQLYYSNIQMIQGTIESRVSKPEDIIQIEKLNQQLTKKSKQCEIMLEQLKWYRLELENKQETYNKIFVPLVSGNNNNENLVCKRKEFKLRRQGRSVTTVREILQSMNGNNSGQNKRPIIPKPKVL